MEVTEGPWTTLSPVALLLVTTQSDSDLSKGQTCTQRICCNGTLEDSALGPRVSSEVVKKGQILARFEGGVKRILDTLRVGGGSRLSPGPHPMVWKEGLHDPSGQREGQV